MTSEVARTSDEHLAYYNENDPKAAAWLRELIKVGALAPGQVDERDVRDVRASELDGFVQCHFFAGIGIWSYALRLAGWSDSSPVWTGSCPCQPFSAAGKGGGFDDERHLWPAWFHLIEQRRPAVIFGEQVASPDGLAWLDFVQTDMEATGHAFAPFDLCAAGFGAPHIRQRLYFVAESDPHGCERSRLHLSERQSRKTESISGRCGEASQLADNAEPGRQSRRGSCMESNGREASRFESGRFCDAGYVNGFWGDAEWIYCQDGKYRPVEPGTFPLAHGAPARVGRLRGYGNAIVAHQAAAFIAAYREVGV